jgi:hypothetical protein
MQHTAMAEPLLNAPNGAMVHSENVESFLERRELCGGKLPIS